MLYREASGFMHDVCSAKKPEILIKYFWKQSEFGSKRKEVSS